MGIRPFLWSTPSPRRGILMYEVSDRVRALKSDLEDFMATHIYPSEAEFYRQAEMLGPWAVCPIIEELKLVARRQGLWNLWHGAGDTGVPLGNLEYASLCEVMGRPLMAQDRKSTRLNSSH